MTEKTNPSGVQEPALFADLHESSLENAESEPTLTTGVATPSKVRVKYNGAETEFDLSTQTEEVQTYIQKGMNYDHVIAERDALKNSEEMAFLQEMARQAGEPDTKKLIAKLKQDMEVQAIQERAAQLVDEGMSARHAQQMAELEVKTKAVNPTPSKNEPDISPLQADFQTLLDEYPEVQQYKDFNDFPIEVQDMVSAGKSPVVAYQKYLLNQKEAQNAINALNQTNKNRDLGSLANPTPTTKEDDFLAGLFGKR